MKISRIGLLIALSSTPYAYSINTTNESVVRTSIESMKEYAQHELAKALVYSNEAQTTKDHGTQQQFKNKAKKSIDALQEIKHYLKSLKKAISKNRSLRYIETEINNVMNLATSFEKMARQELLSIKELPSFTVINEPIPMYESNPYENPYETMY